ncbi:MAG: type III pantothenate kinase [Pseudomonadota bacterium]|jgi:type III pantothenate kinase|nr:type III pantothenate kinase [Alphaproteobacteria bacterium]
MLLAIDVGNTNTVFAVLKDSAVIGEWRSATKDMRTADEYMVWLSQLMQLNGIAPSQIDGTIISTVVPQSLFDIRTLCRKYFRGEPLVVGEDGVTTGLRINMPRPEQVGADRLVNAVAAHDAYPGNLIVIDFGTATTFDVVSEKGDYEGGVIAPGVNLSLQALHGAAAKLPHIAVRRPDAVIGKDTVSAMLSGVYWGYIGLVEGIVSRLKEEFGKPMTVISTGGLGHLLRHGTPAIEHFDPDLTIRGLALIYQYNHNKGQHG